MRRGQKKKPRAWTAVELAEVWDRWERGESSKAIGRALDRGATVYYVLLRHGGIRPRTRLRSPRALTPAERKDISRGGMWAWSKTDAVKQAWPTALLSPSASASVAR